MCRLFARVDCSCPVQKETERKISARGSTATQRFRFSFFSYSLLIASNRWLACMRYIPDWRFVVRCMASLSAKSSGFYLCCCRRGSCAHFNAEMIPHTLVYSSWLTSCLKICIYKQCTWHRYLLFFFQDKLRLLQEDLESERELRQRVSESTWMPLPTSAECL